MKAREKTQVIHPLKDELLRERTGIDPSLTVLRGTSPHYTMDLDI